MLKKLVLSRITMDKVRSSSLHEFHRPKQQPFKPSKPQRRKNASLTCVSIASEARRRNSRENPLGLRISTPYRFTSFKEEDDFVARVVKKWETELLKQVIDNSSQKPCEHGKTHLPLCCAGEALSAWQILCYRLMELVC